MARMSKSLFAASLSFALSVAAPAARAWSRDRILVIVDNRSTNERAQGEIVPAVQDLLEQKGYEVVRDPDVLAGVSIDRAGYVPAPALRDAAQKARADAVVAVKIGFLLEGRARPRGPSASTAIGLLARLYSPDARVLWRNSLAVVLDDAGTRASKTAYVAARRAAEASGARAATDRSPTAIVCEQLLWTLPRGRPDPAARVAKAASAPPAPAAPVKATRFESPPDRARSFDSVARFPLRLDRPRR